MASDVGLPELELFQTEEIYATPTVRVFVGKTGDTPATVDGSARYFQYDEGLGPIGFRAQLRIGNQIEVRTSPVLRLSPHVLYTNVIEPLSRWAFVTKGFALVHGACVAVGENAYLINARHCLALGNLRTATAIQSATENNRALACQGSSFLAVP